MKMRKVRLYNILKVLCVSDSLGCLPCRVVFEDGVILEYETSYKFYLAQFDDEACVPWDRNVTDWRVHESKFIIIYVKGDLY